MGNELRVTSHELKTKQVRNAVLVLSLVTCYLLLVAVCGAELIDRVVAFVDTKAVTLSEVRETYERTRKVQSDVTMDEVLNTMINRVLLLNDARRLKIEGKTDEEILNEYMELKVRALIRIKEESIEEYYKKNERNFEGVPLESVREKIEEYLLEKEANELLKKQIADLRSRSYIRILPGALQ